jgi:hypothetical protein
MPVVHNVLCQLVIKWMVMNKCDSVVHYFWLCGYKNILPKQTSLTKLKTKPKTSI